MLYPETLGSGVSEQERGLWLLLGLFVWFSFVVWGLVCLFGGGFFGFFFFWWLVVCLFFSLSCFAFMSERAEISIAGTETTQ